MLPLSVGVDLIEIERIANVVQRWGDRFLQRVYTPEEIAACRGRIPSLAARFAAKEAVSKVLGVGIGWGGGLTWQDVQVCSDPLGKPMIRLHGLAADLSAQIGLNHWAISLSHSQTHAIAMVVAAHIEPE